MFRLDAKKVASPLDVIAPLLTRVATRPEAKKPESAGAFSGTLAVVLPAFFSNEFLSPEVDLL